MDKPNNLWIRGLCNLAAHEYKDANITIPNVTKMTIGDLDVTIIVEPKELSADLKWRGDF